MPLGDTGALVLLHAFPVDARMWAGVRAELAAAGVSRVLTPDQRGFGRSAPVAEVAPAVEPSLDRVADDVLDLLDRLALDRVVLGGCSMGGYAAMALLAKAPHRVAGLVLIDTRADADDADRRAGRLAMADRAEREGTSWLADTVLPGLVSADPVGHPSPLVSALPAMVLDQAPPAVAWAQRAMAARRDASRVLREFAGPALVIVGEHDVLSPPELAAELAGSMPSAELVEIPGAGHLAPVEAPAAVAAAITTWLTSARL